jgi:hypothetical protein
MVKYTAHFLKKLETLFGELDYVVRYEKGNFNSGYCIVEDRRIAVINRFFDTEARINVLLDILNTLEWDENKLLSEKSAKLYKAIRENKLQQESENEEEPSN